MKAFFSFLFLFFTFSLFAQNQALYFDGAGGVKFTAPDNLPTGTEARTVEFWMKADLKQGVPDNHIFSYGSTSRTTGMFDIFISQKNDGKFYLGFWGHYDDIQRLTELPDDQWHFVTIVYDDPNLKCYLDGDLKFNKQHKINTQKGDFYFGNYGSKDWHYYGALDNFTVWKEARTQEQIQKDMILHYGDMSKMVMHFDFDEGKGTTFGSKLPTQMPVDSKTATPILKEVSATLATGVQWTKPIDKNPTMLSEGIWFLMQNKADVDTDTEVPPRNFAVKAGDKNGNLSYDRSPLEGDYSAFLWRLNKTAAGGYQLVNKKFGEVNRPMLKVIAKKDDLAESSSWQITLSNKAKHGSNAYHLSFEDRVLQNEGAVFSLAAKTENTDQVWLFQPMGLVEGYHIPNSEPTIMSYKGTPERGESEEVKQSKKKATITTPVTRSLKLDSDIAFFASNTCSEWAILNTYLVAKNMVNAILQEKKANRREEIFDPLKNWRREIVLFSKVDREISNYDYPFIRDVFSKEDLMDVNGSSGFDPYRDIWVLVESEMLIGNQSGDHSYREFDHITHEFGHSIDGAWNGEQYSIPRDGYVDEYLKINIPTQEIFAISIQGWFNSAVSYASAARTREELRRDYSNQYSHLDKLFNKENTWMPPRLFRRPPLKDSYPTKIASGTTIDLKDSDKIALQSDFGNNTLQVNKDGNAFIKLNERKISSWYSHQELDIPLHPNMIKFVNGQLLYLFDNEYYIMAGPETPIMDKETWLVLSSENENRARLKVVDKDGNILWQPDKEKLWKAHKIDLPKITEYDVSESRTVAWISGRGVSKQSGDRVESYLFNDLTRYTKRIDVDFNNTPWVIDNKDQLYKVDIDESNRTITKAPSSPTLNGATDLAIHTPGSIWAISKTPAVASKAGGINLTGGDGNFTIVHYGNGQWNTNVNGGGIAIDIENDDAGTPWIVTKQGEVYRYQANNNAWEKINLPTGVVAIDIADSGVSATRDMFVLGNDGFIYTCTRNTTSGSWSFSKESSQTPTGKRLAHTSSNIWTVDQEGKLTKASR